MKHDLKHVLDESLALLGEGQATLEECLDRYPEFAGELRPLLEIALDVRGLPHPASSSAAFAAGKRKMLEALAEKKRRRAVSARPFARHVERTVALLRDAIRRREGPVPWKRTPALPLALASALALFIVAIGGFLLVQRPGGGVARSASLAHVSGAVELMAAGGDAWRPASTGAPVEAGSRVRTGPGSAATLFFFDGSTIDLEGETEVAVIQMSSREGGERLIALYQAQGHTYSRVHRPGDPASRFEIETPAAVAVVHGTEFATTVDASGATRVAVVDGLVTVTSQKTSVAVPAGQMTIVQPGQAPSAPTDMPEAIPSPAATATPTSTPTATPAPTDTSQPPASAPSPAPQLPGEGSVKPTQTPQSSEQGQPPQSPEPAKTHQPPGLTKTPQPPGQTKTPQPPGQTDKPRPPGQEKKPKPNKKD